MCLTMGRIEACLTFVLTAVYVLVRGAPDGHRFRTARGWVRCGFVALRIPGDHARETVTYLAHADGDVDDFLRWRKNRRQAGIEP